MFVRNEQTALTEVRTYFVSTLGHEPEPFLLSLLARSTYLSKNRNRLPPERRAFQSSSETAQVRIRLSSKPFKTIVPTRRCQPIVRTGFPPVLHKEELYGMPQTGAIRELLKRDRTRLPPG